MINKDKLEKLLINTINEGVRFGREIESYKDKKNLSPTIHTTIKLRVKQILNELNEQL